MNETTANNNTELEKLDLVSFLSDFMHRFRRFWWIVVLLTAVGALLFYYRTSVSYSPSYVAEATVSVEIVNGGASANRNTAEQMGLIFPYILTSGALSDVIAADLELNSVPGVISVTSIKGTNLLTISVRSSDPQNAYNVLQSVLRNYPEVAQYVVGQTALTVIDESGIPVDQGREAVVRGSVKKGAAIGFVLGMLFVALQAATFRTVRTESDLRSLVNVPCLGTLPVCVKKQRSRNKDAEINILYDRNRGEYIEAMRLIRTRLERQLEDKQVLMVTSSISGEGKSTVAANLAISMALKGKRVILVDCDLRNPTTAKIFNLKEKYPGLVSVLRGECRVEDTLYEVRKDGQPVGLTLLPGGERESRLVEILGSEAMSNLIARLRARADVVILDTPPSAVLVDAMMLVKYVDAVAYVVMSDFARRRYIFDGMEELSNSDAPIVGCILNGGRTRSGSYGYYGTKKYGYGYYGGYGSYGSKKTSKSNGEKKSSTSKKSEK